jgi:hypothetical protein
VVVVSAVALAGCGKGDLKVGTAAEVAKTWGELVCHRRSDLMNIQVELMKKQQDVAAVHAQLTAGSAKEGNPQARLEGVLGFVREQRKALNACEVSVGELRPLDEGKGGKYAIDVRVQFKQMVWRGQEGALEERLLVLPLEVGQLEGRWFVTSEPGAALSEGQLSLLAGEAAP